MDLRIGKSLQNFDGWYGSEVFQSLHDADCFHRDPPTALQIQAVFLNMQLPVSRIPSVRFPDIVFLSSAGSASLGFLLKDHCKITEFP